MPDDIEAVIARWEEAGPWPFDALHSPPSCPDCEPHARDAHTLATALKEALGLMKAVHESSEFRDRVVARLHVMQFLKQAGVIHPEPAEEA